MLRKMVSLNPVRFVVTSGMGALIGEIVSSLEILKDRYTANTKDKGWKAGYSQLPKIDWLINEAGTHATVRVGLQDYIEISTDLRPRLTRDNIRLRYMRRWVIPQVVRFLSQFHVRGMKATLRIPRIAIRWSSESTMEIIVIAEWDIEPNTR